MESTKLRHGAVVSDMQRDSSGGVERLSFALTAPEGGYYFRMIRAGERQYMLVVQFPEEQRDVATGMKDGFFNSFKITGGNVPAAAGK